MTPDREIPSLDGLRAISIGLVIAFHLSGQGLASPLGNLGVRVFFVISGYLITSLLLKDLRQSGKIDLKRFYWRRTRRIFPAFYVYLAVLAAAAAAGLIAISRADLIEAGLYVINYFPGSQSSLYVRHIWSLAVEEQFYLLWPGLLYFAGRRAAFRTAGLVLFLVPAIRLTYWLYFPGLHEMIDRRFETVADALATGCLLAGLQPRLAQLPRYGRLLRSPWFLAVPAIAYLTYVWFDDRPRLFYTFGLSAVNLAIALSIDRWVRFPASAGGALLNWPPLQWIGKRCYSIYLWQQPFLDPAGTAWFNRFPVNVVCAFGFALVSYYVVEKPARGAFSRVGRRTERIAAD